MKSTKQKIGAWGEARAAEKLRSEEFTIIYQNYRTPYGELDLIAQKANLVIFVEVKTRTSSKFGLPEDAVTNRKKEHILQSIEYYLQEHPDFDCDWRVDVIAIQGTPRSKNIEILWFENALA